MDPGDVLTISGSFVTRRYPEPDSTDVPSNELAYVEFSRPDLPWMFTPASATPEHRLRPGSSSSSSRWQHSWRAIARRL